MALRGQELRNLWGALKGRPNLEVLITVVFCDCFCVVGGVGLGTGGGCCLTAGETWHLGNAQEAGR